MQESFLPKCILKSCLRWKSKQGAKGRNEIGNEIGMSAKFYQERLYNKDCP